MKGMVLGGARRAEDGRTGLGAPAPQVFLLPPLWTPSFPKEPVSLITCRDWETRNLPQILGVPRIKGTLEPVGTAVQPGRAVTGEHALRAPRAPGWAGRSAARFRAHFQGRLPDAVSWTPGIGSRDREPLQVVTCRWKRGRGGGWCEMTSEHWQERTPAPREPETAQERIYCAVHPPAGEPPSEMCQEPRTVRAPFPQLPPGCSLQATSDQRQAPQPGPTPRGWVPEGPASGATLGHKEQG